MQVSTLSAPLPGGGQTPALILPGTYLFKRYDVLLRGTLYTATKRPFEYVLELTAAALSIENRWLNNDLSVACTFQRKGKLASDCHARARDFVRDLKALFQADLESGGLRYRLAPMVGLPIVSPHVLANPYLNVGILKKLRAGMERHGFPTE